MMAESRSQPFDGPEWIFETKWDGYRAIAIMDSGKINLLSRNGLLLNTKFAPIVEALKSLNVDTAILDGELVVIDEEGIPRFELVQRIGQKPKGELIYFAFDLPYLAGRDLTGVPLVQRRELLGQLVGQEGPIRFSRAIEERGKEFFRLARERGLEGIIAKRKDSRYLPGKRSESWLKIKARMQQAAVIGGMTGGSGSRKYFGALMLGVYDKGQLRYVGHTGTGFSKALLKDIHKKLTPYLTDICPFTPTPKADAPVKWVKPRFVCEVAFQEWTSDGIMRAPSLLGLRDDKEPKEVVRES
jgi:bifunctional non-homologous end joining protein LigD